MMKVARWEREELSWKKRVISHRAHEEGKSGFHGFEGSDGRVRADCGRVW